MKIARIETFQLPVVEQSYNDLILLSATKANLEARTLRSSLVVVFNQNPCPRLTTRTPSCKKESKCFTKCKRRSKPNLNFRLCETVSDFCNFRRKRSRSVMYFSLKKFNKWWRCERSHRLTRSSWPRAERSNSSKRKIENGCSLKRKRKQSNTKLKCTLKLLVSKIWRLECFDMKSCRESRSCKGWKTRPRSSRRCKIQITAVRCRSWAHQC